jgi:hypothetical protein
MNSSSTQQTAQQSMKQVAQALTKGLNLGNISVATDAGAQITEQSTSIMHTVSQGCASAVDSFQSVHGDATRDCSISYVKMSDSKNLLTDCTSDVVNNDTAFQSARQIASQSAVAKTEGLDLLGALLLLLLLVLVLPVLGLAGAKRSATGAKTSYGILGFFSAVLLIAGAICWAVGAAQRTVTFYGYTRDGQLDACGGSKGPVGGMRASSAIEAGEKCMALNKQGGGCDAFFWDGSTGGATVYSGITAGVPCGGVENMTAASDVKDGDDKRWAGFVTTPHRVRNVGIGMTAAGALLVFVIIGFAARDGRRGGAAALVPAAVAI